MATKRWLFLQFLILLGSIFFLKNYLFRPTLAQYPTITPLGTQIPTATTAPPVYDGGATCKGSNVSQIICSLTGGANRLYVVAVSNRNNVGVSSVSGVGLTWQKRKVQCSARLNFGLEIWTAFGSPPDGNVTITLNSSSPSVIGSVSRYSGADPSNPVENWVGSNTFGQESTVCSGGSDNSNPALQVTSSLANSIIYGSLEAIRRTISTQDPDYTQIVAEVNGLASHLYVHQRVLNNPGTDTINHVINLADDWLMAGIVIQPVPPAAETPSPTPYNIYGWVYNEINNNINRATAESEGLISGININLFGDALDSTVSQGSPVSGLLANYRFTDIGNGVYFVDLINTPAGSVLYNPGEYTNPQIAIVVGGSVIVDFPFVTVTPTFAPGVPTNTPPGGGLPTNSPTPTNANITPTGVITPTSIITPPEVCQTLPTPDLLAPDHDICTNVKPTFAAYVSDPNGDNVWARYQASEVFDAMGNIAPPIGGESNFVPANYELNQSQTFWWTAFTQSSSCQDSADAPARLLTLDYTPPSQPDPPVCSLVSQDYVTGETTFWCTWEDPGNTFGCGQTVDYHPYFWTEPGGNYWDPGWVGGGGITVVVEDGHELYSQIQVRDNLGNISDTSLIGGPFTAPKINYSATSTPGGPTLTPSLSPTPSETLTPTPGAWLQIKGGDVFQPVINQPVPPGQYFLDLLPTPVENPLSAGLIWTNSGSGNFGFGSSSPINWELSGQLTNAYSFPYYWEALRNKAKTVNSSTVGIIDEAPEGTPAPTLSLTNMTVNDVANAADWHIQNNLQVGNTQYGDRAYTFSDIPAEFLAADWIQTANDSRAYTTEPLVTFDVNIDSTVYVAHEDTITPKPAWMSSWTDSGLNITNGEATPKVFSLYSKEFTAGQVVVGTNGATGKPMYTVIVLPNIASPTPAPTLSLTNMTVNDVANAADWHIQNNLQVGNTQYGDRAYAFSDIPSQFLGSDWIQTANDSKSYTTEPLVTFNVNVDSTVYVAHDDRIASKPAWLSSWTDNGLSIVNSESTPTVLSLYSKDFPAGLVTLGTNGATNLAMYSIIVLPAATGPTPTAEPSGNLDSVNNIYSYQSAGYYLLDPNFDGNRTENPDVTIFLISGTLEISQNFTLSDPDDIVVFIVNGNIHLDGDVTYLPGLYISSQTFNIASSNQPLVIDGMVYGKRFNFLRTFIDPNIPTYQIIYQPEYLIKLLPYLGRSQINWQDLSP